MTSLKINEVRSLTQLKQYIQENSKGEDRRIDIESAPIPDQAFLKLTDTNRFGLGDGKVSPQELLRNKVIQRQLKITEADFETLLRNDSVVKKLLFDDAKIAKNVYSDLMKYYQIMDMFSGEVSHINALLGRLSKEVFFKDVELRRAIDRVLSSNLVLESDMHPKLIDSLILILNLPSNMFFSLEERPINSNIPSAGVRAKISILDFLGKFNKDPKVRDALIQLLQADPDVRVVENPAATKKHQIRMVDVYVFPKGTLNDGKPRDPDSEDLRKSILSALYNPSGK